MACRPSHPPGARGIGAALRALAAAGPWAELDGPAWSRAEIGTASACAVLILASLFWLVHPWYDPVNDGAMYIQTARSIAAGEGYRFLGNPFVIRPPGFSYIISPVIAWRGTDFHALNLLVSLFGVAGIAALYFVIRPRIGWVLAILTCAAIWLNPAYQRLCNQVMSDVPGTALLLGCVLVARWASRRPSLLRELPLGLCIGLSSYVRITNVLLVPAILLSRALDRRLSGGGRESWILFTAKQLAPVTVVTVLVLLPWLLREPGAAGREPADQNRMHSYRTAMWHEDPGDPGSPRLGFADVLARAPLRLHQIGEVLGSRLESRVSGNRLRPERIQNRMSYQEPIRQAEVTRELSPGTIATALGFMACLLWVSIKRRAASEFFAVGALLVMLVYFGFGDRLLLPVYVFLLPAAVETTRDALGVLLGERAALGVTAALVLALVAVDFRPRESWPRIEADHRGFAELTTAISERLAPDARLGSGFGFHYGVYMDRPVYSLHPAVRRAGRPEAVEEVIDKYELDTIVLSPLVTRDASLAVYFQERYGPPEIVGQARLWRVRPGRPAADQGT